MTEYNDLFYFLMFSIERRSKLLTIVTLFLFTAPSAPPYDVQLHVVNKTTLIAHWNDVPLIHQNGVILGYRFLFQREDGSPVERNVTVSPDVHEYRFPGLLIFQNYSIQVLAFAIKGDGPFNDKVYQMTNESGKCERI